MSFKNELLFSRGINFDQLPSWQKRGPSSSENEALASAASVELYLRTFLPNAFSPTANSDPSAGDVYGREAGRQEFHEAYERDLRIRGAF